MTRIGAVCLVTIGIWVVIEIVVGFVRWKHTCYAGVGARLASLHDSSVTSWQPGLCCASAHGSQPWAGMRGLT